MNMSAKTDAPYACTGSNNAIYYNGKTVFPNVSSRQLHQFRHQEHRHPATKRQYYSHMDHSLYHYSRSSWNVECAGLNASW